MHDIFNQKLAEEAKKQGIELLQATIITKPGQAKGFTMAASTERSFLKSVSMLYDLELLDKRRDNLHHANSGLDSTLAKLCGQHDVLVGINLANLRTLDPIIIGRVMQNIELCRTHKAKMAVFSMAQDKDQLMHEPDVRSLLLTLGMSSQQAKETLSTLSKAAKTTPNK